MNKLEENFNKFDRANPMVWDLFVRFAFEAINAGQPTLSAALITERIRWETRVPTTTADGFKVANAHRAYYARKFNRAYPTAKAKFVLHPVAGEEEPELRVRMPDHIGGQLAFA